MVDGGTSPGGDNKGGRIGVGGDIHNLDIEHCREIHCNAANSGSMRGGGLTERIVVIKSVVGSGGNKSGWV